MSLDTDLPEDVKNAIAKAIADRQAHAAAVAAATAAREAVTAKEVELTTAENLSAVADEDEYNADQKADLAAQDALAALAAYLGV